MMKSTSIIITIHRKTMILFIFLENQLVLFRTNTSDSGFYTCHAYNTFSSAKETVMITIEGICIHIIN